MRNGLIVLALVAAVPAGAAVRTVALGGASFYNHPQTVDLGGGNGITFTSVDKTFFAYDPAGVSTTGTTQIGSFGAPFYDPPQPTTYYYNRGGGFGPGREFPLFLSYATPTPVFSIIEQLVGFRFDLGQGYQYGYADIAGSTLYGVRYETTPGASVAFGTVPEPASWALMIGGFGLVGSMLRRRRPARA